MMKQNCIVEGCAWRSAKEVTFFKIPASRMLRKKWLDAINAQSRPPPDGVVCSRHFLQTDYEEFKGKIRLKAKVVPSIFSVKNNSGETKTCDSIPEPDKDLHTDVDVKDNDQDSHTDVAVKDRIADLPTDVPVKDNGQDSHTDVAIKDNGQDLHTDAAVQDNIPDLHTDAAVKNNGQDLHTDAAVKDKDHVAKSESELNNGLETGAKETEDKTELINCDETETEDVEDKTDHKDLPNRDVLIIENSSNAVTDKTQDRNGEPASTEDKDEEMDASECGGTVIVDLKVAEGSDNEKRYEISDGEGTSSPSLIADQDKPLDLTPRAPAGPPDIDKAEDIEELLTNYHIMQNNIHKRSDADERREQEHLIELAMEHVQNYVNNDLAFPQTKAPVFIELAVGQESAADRGDCLMVLESVEVDVDPDALMLLDQEPDHEQEVVTVHDEEPDTRGDPISLLTSSDEDDVIIEEPHIDTVEVSDETDEDDMPLMSLLKKKKKEKKKEKRKQKTKANTIKKMMWGLYEHYCLECHFRTSNKMEYKRHTQKHQKKVLLICQLCGYMTSSVTQLRRHERQHKEDKKYQCHLCEYRAKHNMSLTYHLKSHNIKRDSFKCSECKFRAPNEGAALRHLVACRRRALPKKHACALCDYRTNRPSDFKRHKARQHPEADDAEDMRRHACDKCNYRTKRSTDLRRHRLSRHPDTDNELST